MQRIKIILVLLVLSFTGSSQTIKVNVSSHVLIPGESFSIQYIIEDLRDDDEILQPAFKNFRVVSKPYLNDGWINSPGGSKPVKILSVTLTAIQTGKFIVEGPRIKRGSNIIRGGSLAIAVTRQRDSFEKNAEQGTSEYFLRPGEDPHEKIRKNLFMKIMVNKRECYVGEPVLATFKLYSRLTSKSDIVKNPGFYGFTVQDIINLSDNLVSTEAVNGRLFDVHTIRAVQLYPLRAGIFTVDPMEVMNKVEFSKSAVNKKTEQEIVEGVVESKDPPRDVNTVVYESSMSTEKITIHVKALPEAKRPLNFTGATGNFSIHATLEKNGLARNEEGALVITVSGKGNFTQLSPPNIDWPAGIENFDPVIKDSLDKTATPLKGYRTFRFPFLSSKPGNYQIPPVYFSFFNPDSNLYKTVNTSSIDLAIHNVERKELPKDQEVPTIGDKRDYKSLWIYVGILLVVATIILLQLRKPKKEPVAVPETPSVVPVAAEQRLQPAQFALIAGDNNFYELLQKGIWDHLSPLLNLSGSKTNKRELAEAMQDKNISEELREDVLELLRECETAIFTRADFTHDRQDLLNKAKNTLEKMKV